MWLFQSAKKYQNTNSSESDDLTKMDKLGRLNGGSVRSLKGEAHGDLENWSDF